MKRLFLSVFLLLLSAPAWASTHYIAPTAAGSGNASSCANAAAESTYGGGTYPGGVVAGDTIYACPGTYTSTFFIGGNGTSSAPIAFQCDPAALFSTTVWSASYGAISTGGSGASAWIVNGCTIQNTANGTTLANQAASQGMFLICNGYPCEVENNTVSNLYVKTSGSDPNCNISTAPCSATTGIQIRLASTASGGCVIWYNNTLHDMEAAIYGYTLTGQTAGCFLDENNTVYNSGNPVQIFGSGTSTIASITHEGSTYFNGAVWDTTTDAFHMEAIHDFVESGETISLIDIHNTTCNGSWDLALGGSHFQGCNYLENVSGAGTITAGKMYNNVASTSTPPDGGQFDCKACSATLILNNTLSGAGNTQVMSAPNQGIYNGPSTGVVIENNVVQNFYSATETDSGGSFASANFNDYYNIANWTYRSTFYSTLAAWTSGTTFDANSIVGNPLLNTSYVPQPGSAAIGLGANLTSIYCGSIPALCSDMNGNPRSLTGAWTAGAVNPVSAPQLPLVWVDNNGCLDGTSTLPTYELNLATQTWVGTAPLTGFHVPYWTVGSPTLAGLQSAFNDIEAYRTANGQGFYVDMPDGLTAGGGLISGASGVFVPQSSSALATSCIVVRSVHDANLPNGRTVCSHGIQDNLLTSTDPGIENADCAGDALSYQLGTTITTIPSGAFTLANGTVTNTSAYNDVQYMWTLEGSGSTPTAMRYCSPVGGGASTSLVPSCASTTLAPDHWMFEDMEARIQAGDENNSDIISMPGSGSETATSQYPSYIFFEKVVAHGDWTSLAAGLNSVSNAFDLVCQYCSIVDSQTSQNLRPGSEGHSVLMQGGTFKAVHNWFEGQSIGMLSGGQCVTPSVSGYIAFQNIEERGNRFTFPWAWLGVGSISGNAHWNGSSLVRKNANEIKSGQWIIADGNINENVDVSGGQGGVLGDIKTVNDSCGFGTNYQNIVSDVTRSNEIWRNGLETFEFVRNPGGVGGVDFGMRRVSILNSLFYNISETNFGGSENQGVQINQQAWAWQGTVTENANGTATFVANCSVNEGGCIGQIGSVAVSPGCTGGPGTITFTAPNLPGGMLATGTYDASCVGTVTNAGSGYTSASAVLSGSGAVVANINASSTAPGTGFQVLDMLPGDPATLYQCSSVTSFNQPTPTHYASGYLPSASSASQGAIIVAGVNPASLTTTYTWPTSTTPSGSSDSAGYCKLTNMQGFPQNWTFDHITAVQNSTNGLTFSNGESNFITNGPNFQGFTNLQNSIITNGGITNSSGIAAGSATVKFNIDTTNSTVDRLLLVGANSSSYTSAAYGNNPNNPVASPQLFFPSTPYCPGPTSSGTQCPGFVGAEYYNTSSMVLAPSNWHDLAITSGTYYAAGGTGQASDGTNQGALMPAIDAAETSTLYVCATPCGSPGPYPDVLAMNFTVNVAVYGSGSVVDNDSQISCPIACTGTYAMGFTAILTATPAAGFVFAGWSGSGGCTGTGTCSLTASANPTATFTPIGGGVNVNLSSGTAMSGGTAVTQ